MAGPKRNSKAEQAQTLDQAIAPESTNAISNAEVVENFKPFKFEASSDEVFVISQGNEYTSGKRADDGKTFARIRLVTDDENVLNILENVTNFDGGATMQVCEQERPKDVAIIESDEFSKVIVTIGLRLADPNDEDSDILANINLVKAVSIESTAKREQLDFQREKLSAEKAKLTAQKRFYSSNKMDEVIGANLLSLLQQA
jgi:hypothetical protein